MTYTRQNLISKLKEKLKCAKIDSHEPSRGFISQCMAIAEMLEEIEGNENDLLARLGELNMIAALGKITEEEENVRKNLQRMFPAENPAQVNAMSPIADKVDTDTVTVSNSDSKFCSAESLRDWMNAHALK